MSKKLIEAYEDLMVASKKYDDTRQPIYEIMAEVINILSGTSIDWWWIESTVLDSAGNLEVEYNPMSEFLDRKYITITKEIVSADDPIGAAYNIRHKMDEEKRLERVRKEKKSKRIKIEKLKKELEELEGKLSGEPE